jgi:hypothetical protein
VRAGLLRNYLLNSSISASQHSENLVVTLKQNLLKSDVAQKVAQRKLILADS